MILKKIFANFQILGPLGCQGWVVIPQNVKKSQNHCTLMRILIIRVLVPPSRTSLGGLSCYHICTRRTTNTDYCSGSPLNLLFYSKHILKFGMGAQWHHCILRKKTQLTVRFHTSNTIMCNTTNKKTHKYIYGCSLIIIH